MIQSFWNKNEVRSRKLIINLAKNYECLSFKFNKIKRVTLYVT